MGLLQSLLPKALRAGRQELAMVEVGTGKALGFPSPVFGFRVYRV